MHTVTDLRKHSRYTDPSTTRTDPLLDYERREHLRRIGRATCNNTDLSLADRADGAEVDLRMMYDRSLEAHGRRKGHPAFDVFACMFDAEGTYPSEIAAELRARFGSPLPGIEKGDAYWRGR